MEVVYGNGDPHPRCACDAGHGRPVHCRLPAEAVEAVVTLRHVLLTLPLLMTLVISALYGQYRGVPPADVALTGGAEAAARPQLTAAGTVAEIATPRTEARVPGESGATTSCTPDVVPVAALPPARPIWCFPPNGGQPGTFVSGANSWVDRFEHRITNGTDLGPGYRELNAGPTIGGAPFGRIQNWRHANHWMTDIQAHRPDGTPEWAAHWAMVRPDRTFRFENGVFTMEAEVVAVTDGYVHTANAWPEFVITTAPAPTFQRREGLYAYDQFAGHWTIGCRLGGEINREGESGAVPICAMFDNSPRGAGQGGRVWEISHFQSGDSVWGSGAAHKWGGHPSIAELRGVSRVCAGGDPDITCRDRFTWVIERDRLRLFINGTLYMEHSGFPAAQQIPDALFRGEFYVYFAAVVFRPDYPAGAVVRFHWDALAINAGD